MLQCKVDAVEGYGGLITRCEATVDARESTAASIQQRTGAKLIPPYNYGPTICGQGTMALELLAQVPSFLCPCVLFSLLTTEATWCCRSTCMTLRGIVLTQVPQLDAIVVPICGGGMTSGIAVAAKGIKPGIKIIAAEPTGEPWNGCSATTAASAALCLSVTLACLCRSDAVLCRAEQCS